jgi:hypothetical protein
VHDERERADEAAAVAPEHRCVDRAYVHDDVVAGSPHAEPNGVAARRPAVA